MKKYELMAIFPLDEEKSKKGTEDVRKVLTDFGAEIAEEKLFGDRDLPYEIKKNKRGRFILFTLNIAPAKIAEVEKMFRINLNLLKSQFVKLEDK